MYVRVRVRYMDLCVRVFMRSFVEVSVCMCCVCVATCDACVSEEVCFEECGNVCF